MEGINKLIELGYQFNIIGCKLKAECPDETKIKRLDVAALFNNIGSNKQQAISYVKSLVTLKIDTQPLDEKQQALSLIATGLNKPDTSIYHLTVKAFDYDKKSLSELGADLTGTLDETGGYLLDNYLENPQFAFVHCLHRNGIMYVKLSRVLTPIAESDLLYEQCPFIEAK